MLGYDGMMLDSYFPNNQAISKHWWFRDPPQQKPCYTQSQKRPDPPNAWVGTLGAPGEQMDQLEFSAVSPTKTCGVYYAGIFPK